MHNIRRKIYSFLLPLILCSCNIERDKKDIIVPKVNLSISAVNATIDENLLFVSAPPILSGAEVSEVNFQVLGEDASKVSIDTATGIISMLAKDFEQPEDKSANNKYNLILLVTDKIGNTATTDMTITVIDVLESNQTFGDKTLDLVKKLKLTNVDYGFSSNELKRLSGLSKGDTLILLPQIQINFNNEIKDFLAIAPRPSFVFSNTSRITPENTFNALKRNTISILDKKDGITLSRELKNGSKLAILRDLRFIPWFGGRQDWVLKASLDWINKDKNKIGYFDPLTKKGVSPNDSPFGHKFNEISNIEDIDNFEVLFLTGTEFDKTKCDAISAFVSSGKNIVVNWVNIDDHPVCIQNLIKDKYDIDISLNTGGIPARRYSLVGESQYKFEDIYGWGWGTRVVDFTKTPEIIKTELDQYITLYSKAKGKNISELSFLTPKDVITSIMSYVELIDSINTDEGWNKLELPSLTIVKDKIQLSDNQPFYLFDYSLDGGLTWHKFGGLIQPIPSGHYNKGYIKIRFKESISKFHKNDLTKTKTLNENNDVDIKEKVNVIDFENPVKVSLDGNHIQVSGRPDGYGVDWVFLAEGYTVDQKDRFINDVKFLLPFDRDEPLFKHLLEFYNIHVIFAVSNEEGASTSTIKKDTAFGAQYDRYGMSRLMYGNEGAVSRYINKYLDNADMRSVIVNSSRYGGAAAGGTSWAYSKGRMVMIHETAHGFAGLHDEYLQNSNKCDKNVCNDVASKSYWAHYLNYTPLCNEANRLTPSCIFTPVNKGYDPAGWYGACGGGDTIAVCRPSNGSIMHWGGHFGVVNAEIWARAVYRTTKPFLVKNSDGILVKSNTLKMTNTGKITDFRVNKLSGDVKLDWYINDVKQIGHKEAFSFMPIIGQYYKVKVIGYDNSGLIHSVKLEDTKREFTWEIGHVSSFAYNYKAIESSQIRLKIRVTSLSIDILDFESISGFSAPISDYTFDADPNWILSVKDTNGKENKYLPKNIIRIDHNNYKKINDDFVYTIVINSNEEYSLSSGKISTTIEL